jgi:uncharacterized protein (UPF0332 family)
MSIETNAEIGPRILEQAFELWITPERNRRLENGSLSADDPLIAAQVLFHVNAPIEVRLNEQVRALSRVRATRPMEAGEEVRASDISEILSINLTPEDPNAAHVTLILHQNAWHISFNFQYNRGKSQQLIFTAREYFDASKEALEKGRLRVFVDNLYSSVELAAKARLILIPNESHLKAKSHEYVLREFNKLTKDRNVSQSHSRLLNELQRMRNPAKYSMDTFVLDLDRGAEMLFIAEEMISSAEREFNQLM